MMGEVCLLTTWGVAMDVPQEERGGAKMEQRRNGGVHTRDELIGKEVSWSKGLST